jgi:hypothetical protein
MYYGSSKVSRLGARVKEICGLQLKTMDVHAKTELIPVLMPFGLWHVKEVLGQEGILGQVLKYKNDIRRDCLFTASGEYGAKGPRPQFRLSTDVARFPLVGQRARVRIP